MKHIIKSGVIVITLFCSVIFAGDKPVLETNSHYDIINFNQVTKDHLATFIQGSESLTIEVSKGTTTPLHLTLGGELLHLYNGSSNEKCLEVKKTFYVRHHNNNFLFSHNLENWSCLDEFITGNISAGLQFGDRDELSFALGGVVDIRS